MAFDVLISGSIALIFVHLRNNYTNYVVHVVVVDYDNVTRDVTFTCLLRETSREFYDFLRISCKSFIAMAPCQQ